MSKERWTNSDEMKLQSLMERKQRLTEQNMKPLVKLVETHINAHDSTNDIAETLAYNADAFRDALEPFDSGIRSAEVSALG